MVRKVRLEARPLHRRRSSRVTVALYDVVMGEIIDIGKWRRVRLEVATEAGAAVARARVPGAAVREAGGMAAEGPDPDERELAVLERAVQRLHPLVSEHVGRGSRLGPSVETELLAIMGELTVGLVRQAAQRADRLAERLAAGGEGLRH